MRIPASGWMVKQKDRSSAAHVIPVDDLIEHTEKRCVCRPRWKFQRCAPDDIATILVHNSLDGREQVEGND